MVERMQRTKQLIDLIVAARPNFVKIAPLHHALAREDWCTSRIVHTGQHPDADMSDVFFRDLSLPAPAVNLGIAGGRHGEHTGGVMIAYERFCLADPPDWVVVVGDVNSTVACALVAAKLHIPVAHLEAGLRCGDRSMPEEVNRVVTDAIADLLWTPSADADANLAAEGRAADRIDRIGNILIDSYELSRERIDADTTRLAMGLERHAYAVVTLHRPANVDDPDALARIVRRLVELSGSLPLVFPVHPRTRRQLADAHLLDALTARGLRVVPPLGYVPFMNLVRDARVVITDSGGLQEETTYLGVPCLTLREVTERPITVAEGTNRLVRADGLVDAVLATLAAPRPEPSRLDRWDGHAAQRAVASLRRRAAPGR
jgi:UDP-N-acetylglucosamine 2-epimerase (non-hydrolysing)